MKTIGRSLALAACVVGTAALAPGAAFAAGGHGAGAGWHGGGGNGRNFHGGGSFHGGHRDHWGHRGFVRSGLFWGGLGIGAIGYYGGWWGPYAPSYSTSYAPYYYNGYYDDAAPALIVSPGAAPDPIFYPKNGQSAATAESDRRDCNRWATTQNGAMADASVFQRATFACMEGRGYTIK